MIRLIEERVMEKLRDKPENIDLEEFMSLVVEWREDKAPKAKCPYCVEPIQKQATKCNHCFSEIEWFKFDGLYGPCKAGASSEIKDTLNAAKARHLAELGCVTAAIIAEKKATLLRDKIAEGELLDLLSKLATRKCAKCPKPVFTSDKLKNTNLSNAKMLYEHPDYYNKCEVCAKQSENVATFIVFVLIILIIFSVLISG